MECLDFIDKRTKEDLAQLFKGKIDYDVSTIDRAVSTSAGTADFLIAHHVLEHLANPIAALMLWLPLLKPDGRLFLSIPAETNGCEKDRVWVPFSHIIDDYVFDRNGDDFDSKQHLPHFVLQWEVFEPGGFWYS